MSQGFEFFEGAATENTTEARVTVRRGGHLVLTQATVEMLGEGVTHVQLGFNPETKAVGIRPASEEVRGRYRLRSQSNSLSHLVDGKRFFKHHGVKLEKARSFAAEAFPGGIVGFRMAETTEPAEGGKAPAEADAKTEAKTGASSPSSTPRRKAKAAS